MYIRLVILSLVCLFALPAKAQVRYDRLHLACNDKSPACQTLVSQIEKELYFAELVRQGSGFSDLWLITMNSVKANIEKLKRDFPDVWEAQSCPMGACQSQRDLLHISPQGRPM